MPNISPEEHERRETEQLKNEPKVRRALRGETDTTAEQVRILKENRVAVWVFVLVFIVAAVLYYLFGLEVVAVRNRYIPLLQRGMASLMVVMVILIISRLVKTIFEKKVDNPSTRYNLGRILNLVTALLISFVLISMLFTNWYTAVVSLGLISLILGLALQPPLASFFAWIFILIRKPYEVGDRIKIGNVTGDVIDLSYFDTTLWEFRGDYLSGDHPSGRIIRFANSKVFSEYITNYSWPLFPYIWNELKFYIASDSDLDFVRENLQQILQEDIGEQMLRRVTLYRNILRETPVDDVDVRRGGSVFFRAHESGVIKVVVRYVVPPKESGKVKNRLFHKMLQVLRSHPNKVRLP